MGSVSYTIRNYGSVIITVLNKSCWKVGWQIQGEMAIFILCRPGCMHVSGWIYLCSNATQHPFKTWTIIQQKLQLLAV